MDAYDNVTKGGIEGRALEAIATHDARGLKERLIFKAQHKTSRARLMDRRQGRSKLMIQEVIDQSKAELELKQKLTAEKEARARAGKANQGKGKAAAPWAKKARRSSTTSSEA